MKMFKSFLRGLLYVVLSPLIIAAFALYVVYSIVLFFYEFLVATFKFFSGEKLTTKLKEDEKVEDLVKKKDEELEKEKENEEKEVVVPQPTQNTTTINNFYITQDQLPIDKIMNSQNTESQQPKQLENKDVLEIEVKEGEHNNE